MSTEQTRFDWEASDSAPEYYDMKIISGDFRYHDTPSGAGLYVPSGGRISHGWGRSDSSHVTGETLKPLPDKLDITFYSYLEDQFYRGSFDLPYEKILRLFQDAEAGPKRRAMNGDEIPNRYVVTVGVAPGGTVAVWMSFYLGQRELFFGKAKKIEMDFAEAFRIPIANQAERKEYVNEILEATYPPELLAEIRNNPIPFDKWENYRIRYNWTLTFPVSNPPGRFRLGFFNGEGSPYKYPMDGKSGYPIPDILDFKYVINGVQRYYDLVFDEAEMFDAFTRLNAKQLPMQLEIDPKFPIEQTHIRLHNGKESIELKNFKVK